MDIFAIREAIAAAVQGLTVLEFTVDAKAWLPDSVSTTPLFFCAEYDAEYDRSMRGLTRIELTCRVLVGHSDEYTAQKTTDVLFAPSGASSLKAVIEAERDHENGGFGGLCSDFRIMRMQGNRLYDVGGVKYVGGELVIEVIGE